MKVSARCAAPAILACKPLTNLPWSESRSLEHHRAGRAPLVVLAGVLGALVATLAYSFELASLTVPTPQAVSSLVPVAEAFFVVVLFCIVLVLAGMWRVLLGRMDTIRSKGVSPLSPGWVIPYVLSFPRYRRSFLLSAALYGLFYSIITSMMVYQPTVDFAQAYGAPIPSVQVTPVQAAPLFTPVVTVYIVNHLGLLLIPLTLILLAATAGLVGVNLALAAFAFDSRVRGAGRGWVGGLGAVVGLFTGCPTCAGLFFANFLGGTGAASFAALLGFYQPVFILLSIPVLLAAPYLTSRGLARVYKEGCVVLRPS